MINLLNKTKNDVVNSMNGISEVSNQTQILTREVSDAIYNQKSALELIYNDLNNLENESNLLKEQIDSFDNL